jgi:hypothetical protein
MEDAMTDRAPAEGPGEDKRGAAGRATRWLVAALAVAVLSGCEHGSLSFDKSTGQFKLPVGAGSRGQGSNR